VIRGDRHRLQKIVDEQLSPVGRLQVNTALAVMDTLDDHIETGCADGCCPPPGTYAAPACSCTRSTAWAR
jgi:hypothetical protein